MSEMRNNNIMGNTQHRTFHLGGMGKVEAKFALLLDIDRVLSRAELEASMALQSTQPDKNTAAART